MPVLRRNYNDCSGQLHALPHRNSNGRFTSASSRNSDNGALTLRATSGHASLPSIAWLM
jgi:hypothetical protein